MPARSHPQTLRDPGLDCRPLPLRQRFFLGHLALVDPLPEQTFRYLAGGNYLAAIAARQGRFHLAQVEPPFLSAELWQSRQRLAKIGAMVRSKSGSAARACNENAQPQRLSIKIAAAEANLGIASL